MNYKLLSTGKGVILSRQPKVVKDTATFMFYDAPIGAMAVFSISGSPGATYYRELNSGRCNIPVKYLDGDVSVTLTLKDRTTKNVRYVCEGIKATKLSDGVLLAPDDSNLAEEFAKSRVEVDELRRDFNSLKGEFEELKTIFEKMKEGYGLV